jgi:Lon protease-like protein
MRVNLLAVSLALAGLLAAGGPASAQSAGPDRSPGADTLPSVIPIFPLEDAMLFPNGRRPFHIFEPRYRAMIADALKGDRVIGMVTLKPGYEADYEGRPPIYEIGCAGVIADVETLPDGRLNILLRGLVKFRVISEDRTRPYRLARVDAMPESSNAASRAVLQKQRKALEAFVTTSAGGPGLPPEMPDEEVVDTIAQYVPLEPPEHQALLELDGALARADALLLLLDSPAAPLR